LAKDAYVCRARLQKRPMFAVLVCKRDLCLEGLYKVNN